MANLINQLQVTVPDPNLQMAVRTCKSVDTMQIKTISLNFSSFVPFLAGISDSGGYKVRCSFLFSVLSIDLQVRTAVCIFGSATVLAWPKNMHPLVSLLALVLGASSFIFRYSVLHFCFCNLLCFCVLYIFSNSL